MIEERYLSAASATNLRDVPHVIGQVDLIKASGMSSRNMAAHYLRLITKPAKGDMLRVYAALLRVTHDRKLPGGTDAIVAAIDWLVDPRCKVCEARGVVVKKGKEHACPKCRGEKFRKEPSCKTAQLLIDYVMTCRSAHSGRMFKLLH
ncbi:MAG: hypothetical protein LBJ15_19560 [Comamonas sp.]|jgi:hypothetical protein|uniref:hypothetical protein n=1 Tax=Comamonas sp. TaxID=34028 RepID=UPI00281BA198|nr:hypothetical protein [Comamonas sp.]MDR0216173.1 hypothetical protein [Comamonas sp.]